MAAVAKDNVGIAQTYYERKLMRKVLDAWLFIKVTQSAINASYYKCTICSDINTVPFMRISANGINVLY